MWMGTLSVPEVQLDDVSLRTLKDRGCLHSLPGVQRHMDSGRIETVLLFERLSLFEITHMCVSVWG